jgi:hypothetical protein
VGILSSRRANGQEERVAEFWSWWAANRERVIAAAQADRMEELAQLLDPAVDRLHKEVGWEFGPGLIDNPWQLVVTPGGVRAMLPFTIEWAEAAPPDDLVEFHPVRPRLPGAIEGAVLEMEGSSLALDETLVRVTSVIFQESMDVEVHHSAFSTMSEDDQYGVAFQALDLALGEFVVMTCLQRIVPRTVRGPDMQPIAALSGVIKEAFPNEPR